MRRSLRAAALAGLTLALAVPAMPVSAAQPAGGLTVYIDDDGLASASGCDGGTIVPTDLQTAVDTTGVDATIWVCPGTYVGQVLIEGPGHDGLTVRAVSRWTTIIRPPAEESTPYLVRIDDADRVTVQNLRFLIPGRRYPCRDVRNVIDIEDALKTAILANRIVAKGPGTYDCGYRYGVVVQGGSSDQGQSATISWNLIQDFQRTAIEVCATRATRIHRNSLRFLHAAEPYAGAPSGRAIYVNSGSACGPGPVVITGNVITSPASAQVSTNVLTEGMLLECCVTKVSGNRITHVQVGIYLQSRDQAPVAEGNILVGTVPEAPPESKGFRVQGIDLPIIVRDNTVSGFNEGVVLDSGDITTIEDNDLAANTIPCLDRSDRSNTWTNNLGCPDGPVTPAP